MTGHRLLQIQPVRSWWVATCTCGHSTTLAESRDRAADLLDQHLLDVFAGEHTDPITKGPDDRPA